MRLAFIVTSFFLCSVLHGQNLSGTWIGKGGGTDLIKLVIRQWGDSLMGYTYDVVDGYCYASFHGKFFKEEQRVIGRGGVLLEHTDNHILTDYDWILEKRGSDFYLVENKSQSNLVLEKLLGLAGVNAERQWLKRVSKTPELLVRAKDSIAKKNPTKPAEIVSPTVKSPQISKPKIKPQVTPSIPKEPDSVSKSKPVVTQEEKPLQELPVIKVPDYIIQQKQIRASKLMRTIYTSVDSIKVYLYDNGEIDGDTVTVFYDEQVVLDRFMISDKAKILTLPVSRDKIHTLDLFANNLGAIPPNTALLIIIAGKARYELYASYDFKSNARILIKYQEE